MAAEKRTAREKERLVLQLRAAGHGFDLIAERVGYANRGSACKAYQRAMRNATELDLSDDEWRRLSLHRLDVMQAGLWPKASRGDLGAVREVARLEQLRMKVKGYAIAPGRSSASAGEDGHDAEGVVVGPDRLTEIRERRARDAAERSARS